MQMLAPGLGEIGEPGVLPVGVLLLADQASNFTTSESGFSLVRLLALSVSTVTGCGLLVKFAPPEMSPVQVSVVPLSTHAACAWSVGHALANPSSRTPQAKMENERLRKRRDRIRIGLRTATRLGRRPGMEDLELIDYG